MIKSTVPITAKSKYRESGFLYIELEEEITHKDESVTYFTTEWYLIGGVKVPMPSDYQNKKTYSLEKINQLKAIINANFSEMLNGIIDQIERERKIKQIGLWLDVTTDLFEDGKTIHDLLPSQWEMFTLP